MDALCYIWVNNLLALGNLFMWTLQMCLKKQKEK